MTEYCAVIGPAPYKVAQKTAVKQVTRPLPSLAKCGVATCDYRWMTLPDFALLMYPIAEQACSLKTILKVLLQLLQ